MVYLGISVLGVLSFARLPIDLLPDVAFPTLSVWTTYSDAAPPEVERFITEPVEQEVSQVPGVRRVTSRSREGQSLVTLQFYWGTDMEFAALNVRERLDDLRDILPRSVDRPVILRSDPGSDPILTLAVSGASPAELLELSKDVFARRLEQQDGVALAAISGGREREIQVLLDPARLTLYRVTVAQVTDALDRANYQAPGGSVRRGRFRYSLRTLGQFTEVEQLRDVVVARPTGGTPVRLSDVAEVRDGFAERQTAARYSGVPAVGLQIFKESGSNTVRVAERVEVVLDELRAEFPSLGFEIATSQAEFIREAIANVVQALIVGGILAFLVLFLFLRDPRYPVAVGLAIPISILAAFSLCYLFDVSLNVMSLGGLALGVGMLVDNSIVVLENVFRHRNEGEVTAPAPGPGEAVEPRDAAAHSAAEGSREVAGAITASTLTTIAVFGPVLYVRGVAGALFGDLSLAVAFSLLASLLVALTLLPVMAARFGRAGVAAATSDETHDAAHDVAARTADEKKTRPLRRALRFTRESVRLTWREVTGGIGHAFSRLTGPALEAFDRGFRGFAGRYEGALAWALGHRSAVIGLAASVFAAAISLATVLPRDLMPDVDERQFRVALDLPVGTPIEATDEAAAALEAVLLELEAVDGVFTRVGRAQRGEPTEDELAGLNSAVLEVRLRPTGEPTSRVVSDFRSRLARTGIDPGAVAIETGRSTALGRTLDLDEADLAVRIQGDELADLVAVAESAKARLVGLPQLRDGPQRLRCGEHHRILFARAAHLRAVHGVLRKTRDQGSAAERGETAASRRSGLAAERRALERGRSGSPGLWSRRDPPRGPEPNGAGARGGGGCRTDRGGQPCRGATRGDASTAANHPGCWRRERGDARELPLPLFRLRACPLSGLPHPRRSVRVSSAAGRRPGGGPARGRGRGTSPLAHGRWHQSDERYRAGHSDRDRGERRDRQSRLHQPATTRWTRVEGSDRRGRTAAPEAHPDDDRDHGARSHPARPRLGRRRGSPLSSRGRRHRRPHLRDFPDAHRGAGGLFARRGRW